ncbi:MAG: ferritin-like domain-containing protein [Gammaproteobacteria bacterium]|nr:ferritin-like domain-containing protein [Gammaproteobacteria bacterium]MDP2139581.1 ferritin-like domain-containing protein [Gammaproteobacteria bacterium]MDP2346554.1 ferritin-like domain-containing protein [Gammaproteobacteria bacterium]
MWKYEEEPGRIHSLYELAKARMWNARSDVPWQDSNHNHPFPTLDEGEPMHGFSAYDALAESDRCRISWWRHALEISEILHGEQGALLVSSQLVSCMPTVEAKLFASSQVFDEARHVEFFSRYLHEIVGEIHPPSNELRRLIQTMVDDPRWDMKFIACQILIESLAMAKFQEIRQYTRVPVLAFAIDYIAADEARHVKFGVEFLKEHLRELSSVELAERSDFVLDNVLRLANSLNVYTRIAEKYGWDVAALRHHLRQYRIRHPEINRNRFRQLFINMKAVGLLTERTHARMMSMEVFR